MVDLRAFRDALDRVARGQALPDDQERLTSSIRNPQLLAIAVAICPELRPGTHETPDDHSHAKHGITELRRLIWTAEFLADHPAAVLVQSSQGRWPGTFQHLWRHLCGGLSLSDASEGAYLRGCLAWAQLDVLGDSRTGITSSPSDYKIRIPQIAPTSCTKLFRDTSILPIKRTIAMLHERRGFEENPVVVAKLKEVTEELEQAVNTIHRELFGKPLPPYKPSSSPSTAVDAPPSKASNARRSKAPTTSTSKTAMAPVSKAPSTLDGKHFNGRPGPENIDEGHIEEGGGKFSKPSGNRHWTAVPVSPMRPDRDAESEATGARRPSIEGDAGGVSGGKATGESEVGVGDGSVEMPGATGDQTKRKAKQSLIPQYFKKLRT